MTIDPPRCQRCGGSMLPEYGTGLPLVCLHCSWRIEKPRRAGRMPTVHDAIDATIGQYVAGRNGRTGWSEG